MQNIQIPYRAWQASTELGIKESFRKRKPEGRGLQMTHLIKENQRSDSLQKEKKTWGMKGKKERMENKFPIPVSARQ